MWSAAEAREVLERAGLGGQAEANLAYLGISEAGNFEGSNVLNIREGAWTPRPDGFEAARAALLAARGERVRPGLDDKVLTSWNALMIAALAESGAALAEPGFVAAATECADFILERMRDGEGRLLRTFGRGEARLNAYLEDHAYLLEALLALYEAGLEPRFYAAAREIADTIIERFGDTERGGFFTTSHDHERLVARRKDLDDHPIPSGNSSAALGLLRLGALSGERRYAEWGEGVLKLLAAPAERHPQALSYALLALDFSLGPVHEVALVVPAGAGVEEAGPMLRELRSRYRPRVVTAAGPEGADQPPLLAGRPALDGGPAAYVCEQFACRTPVGSAEALAAELG